MNEALAVIAKNAREVIHVSLTVIGGCNVIDLRVHEVIRGNKLVPTEKGIAMDMKKLPAFVTALRKVERYARKAGLLDDIK